MNITIVGAGNIGVQFAVHCAKKGHKVTFFTKNYKKISNKLEILDEKGNIFLEAEIFNATDNPKGAFLDSDLIFITYPAFLIEEIANKILPHIKSETLISIVPAFGGGECAFRPFIEKGGIVFGLQRVPSVARLVEYGKKVCAKGYRSELFVSSIPNKYSSKCAKIIEEIFDIKCSCLPNYLNLTVTPSNPVLHTSRLYSLFKNYKKGVIYSSIPLFYEDWDIDSSKILLKCDNELCSFCKNNKLIDLSSYESLMKHYESNNEIELTNKITNIESLKGIKTPSVEVQNGYIPDFNSRYFSADFPFGLNIIRQIFNMFDYKFEYIDIVYNWYKNLKLNQPEFQFERYKISKAEQLIDFYAK